MGAKGRKDNFAASVYRIMPPGRAPSPRGEDPNSTVWSAKTDKWEK